MNFLFLKNLKITFEFKIFPNQCYITPVATTINSRLKVNKLMLRFNFINSKTKINKLADEREFLHKYLAGRRVLKFFLFCVL